MNIILCVFLLVILECFMVTSSIKEMMYDIEKSNFRHLKSSLKILIAHAIGLAVSITIGFVVLLTFIIL